MTDVSGRGEALDGLALQGAVHHLLPRRGRQVTAVERCAAGGHPLLSGCVGVPDGGGHLRGEPDEPRVEVLVAPLGPGRRTGLAGGGTSGQRLATCRSAAAAVENL